MVPLRSCISYKLLLSPFSPKKFQKKFYLEKGFVYISLMKEQFNEAFYNLTPYDGLIIILAVLAMIIIPILAVLAMIIIPPILTTIFKSLFYYFMRKVFKVERMKYIKGWKRIKENKDERR